MSSGSRDGSRALNRQTFTGPWAGLPVASFRSSGLKAGTGETSGCSTFCGSR